MRTALLLLAALACFGAPQKKKSESPREKVHLSLTYSERNGLAFPCNGSIAMLAAPVFGGAALASALQSLNSLGTMLGGIPDGKSPQVPKTTGEMMRTMMSSPANDIAASMPFHSNCRAQLEANLVWDPQQRAYVVESGTLTWTGNNNSRFQTKDHLLYCNLNGGGSHKLKRDEVKVKFPEGDPESLNLANDKAPDSTYDLILAVSPKEEPIIGEGGWVAGGGKIFEIREKFTTAGTESRITDEYKPTPDGNDIQASGHMATEKGAPFMFAPRLSYQAEQRPISDRTASFAETWMAPGGTNTAISWRLGRAPGKVHITKVEQKEGPRTADPRQVVFSSGTLTVVAEAQVSPPERARELKWEAPDIGEVKGKVQSRVVEPGHVRAEITYAKLPAQNASFGSKDVKARLSDQTDQKSFEVFFERDGKDHPAGQGQDAGTPNWFFYWKQGAVPELDRFEFTEDPVMGGGYSLENKRLCVTQSSPDTFPAQDVNLRTKDGAHSYHLVREKVKGIQAVAAVVRHELKHKELFDQVQWPGGKDPYWKRDGTVDPDIHPGNDYDEDSVPDGVETGSGSPWLDPFQACTYANFTIGLFFPDPKDAPDTQAKQVELKGDNELLAIVAERKRVCREDQDWAFPGTKAQAAGN